MYEPGPHARPTHEDQEGRPVTMNNDTPQIFGEDTHDHPQDPGQFPEHDGGAFPAFHGWAGWGDRVEPVAPGDDHPKPSFSPYEPPPYDPGYLPRHEPSPHEPSPHEPSPHELPPREPRYPSQPGPGQPGYPQGPGYAPDEGYAPDSGYVRRLGYPQDPGDDRDPGDERDSRYPNQFGYLNDSGYTDDAVYYVPDGDYAPDLSYPRDAGDMGLVHDAGPVPLMEPLPDPQDQAIAPPRDMAPPRELASPLPTRVPPVAPDGRGAIRDEGFVLLPHTAADPDYVRETSDSLTTESLLHGKRAAPGSGWRRSVFRATGGLLRFGESAAEMRRRDLINRVRTPVAGGHHRVAVLSLKGGVGKTTTAVGLGATLATLRGDRVIAIDANPDRGTLSDKVRLETAATIRDLLNERDQVSRYADVRAFTSQAPSRLEVLASDRDPGVSVAFGADDYCDAARMLEHFYSICITDCGTGLLHSAMSGVLRLADQIVLVSSPSVDGARSASATLDWLEAHNCGDLVRNGVVVLSAIRPKSKSTVDLDRLEHHFAARCRAVARIPYDPHLEEGAEIELELLSSETAEAYLALAAVVGDGLAWPRRLTSRSALP
jgi:MinD-like ATPase involved in chromosome partitioning or flagellar assembly